MACKWLKICIVLHLLKLKLVFGISKVPCYFIFGDSLVDNGNNNRLTTVANVNYPPYGIDFKDGPTGRYTNGRTRADFISQLLGFDNFIPSYLSTIGHDDAIFKGVNYASGGSGILPITGTTAGKVIGFDEQLHDHERLVEHITAYESDKNYLNKCLYTVGFGSNDFINNYLKPMFYLSSHVYGEDEYIHKLITDYNKQLQTLYHLGARKVAVFSLGPIGCAPFEMDKFSDGNKCAEKPNKMAQKFDNQLMLILEGLNLQFPDAKFTFINMTSIADGIRATGIIEVLNKPCCEVSKLSGLCSRINGKTCSDRSKYAFFDLYHPTDILNELTANRSYNAQSATDAFPVDIFHLVNS